MKNNTDPTLKNDPTNKARQKNSHIKYAQEKKENDEKNKNKNKKKMGRNVGVFEPESRPQLDYHCYLVV